MKFIFKKEQLDLLKVQLQKQGVVLSSDDGTLEKEGVTIHYNYKEPVLTLEIIHKPMFISQGYIEGRINDWFRSAENASA